MSAAFARSCEIKIDRGQWGGGGGVAERSVRKKQKKSNEI